MTKPVLPEGLPTNYPVRKCDQSPEKFAAGIAERASIEPPIPVLLLQGPDCWLAMLRPNTNMREVRGATIEEAQEGVRHQWSNPLPLRFPEDFPLMEREFNQLMRHGTLHQDDGEFKWYTLTLEDRERSLREVINEAMASDDG